MFGPDVCKMFLERNKLVALIRSHQCVKIGYEWPFGNKNMLATVFSASNYCGSGNQGQRVCYSCLSHRKKATEISDYPILTATAEVELLYLVLRYISLLYS